MPGIGDTLRSERERQGRTLADAAAETRVRESYLAAIEEEDFGVLGGDVYARGFIRLYGKYLGLDAESLVHDYRSHHEQPAEVTAIPGAEFEEVRRPALTGAAQLATQPPILAGVGLVLLLVVLALFARGGGGEDPADEVDEDAMGPSPAAVAQDAPTAGADAGLADLASEGTGTDPGASDLPGTPTAGTAAADPAAGADGQALQQVQIQIEAIQPVTLSVTRGSPVVSSRPLEPGETLTVTDPQGQEIRFTLSDFSAAEVLLNGDLLDSPQLAGRAVEITCTVGRTGCDAVPL